MGFKTQIFQVVEKGQRMRACKGSVIKQEYGYEYSD